MTALTDAERDALVADARSHKRRVAPYCKSCVDGIERLAARLAAVEAERDRLSALILSGDREAYDDAEASENRAESAEQDLADLRARITALHRSETLMAALAEYGETYQSRDAETELDVLAAIERALLDNPTTTCPRCGCTVCICADFTVDHPTTAEEKP